MTKEEQQHLSTQTQELKEKLDDLAGRYRMRQSGAYQEVKQLVDKLNDYVQVPNETDPNA